MSIIEHSKGEARDCIIRVSPRNKTKALAAVVAAAMVAFSLTVWCPPEKRGV